MILIINGSVYCFCVYVYMLFTFKSIFVLAFPPSIQMTSCFPCSVFFKVCRTHVHVWKNPVPCNRWLARYIYCISCFDCITYQHVRACILSMWLHMPPVMIWSVRKTGIKEWPGLILDVSDWQKNCVRGLVFLVFWKMYNCERQRKGKGM